MWGYVTGWVWLLLSLTIIGVLALAVLSIPAPPSAPPTPARGTDRPELRPHPFPAQKRGRRTLRRARETRSPHANPEGKPAMNDHVTHAAGHGAPPDSQSTGTNRQAGPAQAPETPPAITGPPLDDDGDVPPHVGDRRGSGHHRRRGWGSRGLRPALRGDDGRDDDAHAGAPLLRPLSRDLLIWDGYTLRYCGIPEIQWHAYPGACVPGDGRWA
jgi:hypothetical protein